MEITSEFFNKYYDNYLSNDYYLKYKTIKSPVFIAMESKDGKYWLSISAKNYTSGIDLTDDKKAIIAATVYYSSSQLNGVVKSTLVK
jgi:hypothetical protein